MNNPYENFPKRAFWRTAIADINPLQIQNIWRPKYTIGKNQKISTAGSCFAQHISKALIMRGFTWLDGETAPKGLSDDSRIQYNYGVFSFRTGNIYTTSLLKQWLQWALKSEPVPDEVWQNDGLYYDPFRPAIEPNGFLSIDELMASRENTLSAIKNVLAQSDIFIFTLGLTEAWVNKIHGYVYPMCPGSIAGAFDRNSHKFVNYCYQQIYFDLRESFNLIKEINPEIKFLLTVSPVPLTATASNKHVLVATTYSKSTLRAVAGDLTQRRLDVDYFPSYELVASYPFRGMFYMENLRNVSADGVSFVMNTFFNSLGNKRLLSNITMNDAALKNESNISNNNDVVCEEELLSAFQIKKDSL